MTAAAPATLARVHRATLAAALGAVTLAGWWCMARAGSHAMHAAFLSPALDSAAGAGAFAAATAMWMAMAAAMMTPTTWSWILAFAVFVKEGGKRPVGGAVAAFLVGYFAVWLAYSAAGATLQMLLARAGWMGHGGRLPSAAAGAVLIAAGVVHWTPLSQACLRHCRNPLTYFAARWRNGPPSGFATGLAHGAYCVGCCWALMLTGFAMGVMNLIWMAALTALVCVEKLAPRGERVATAASAALVFWGIALLV